MRQCGRMVCSILVVSVLFSLVPVESFANAEEEMYLQTGQGESGLRIYQTSADEVLLGGNYLELGLRSNGTFGTREDFSNAKTMVFHPGTTGDRIGLRASGGEMWGSSETYETNDYLLSDNNDEGWLIGWSATEGGTAKMMAHASLSSSSTAGTLQCSGLEISYDETEISVSTSCQVRETVRIEQDINFAISSKYFYTTVTLYNDSAATIYDLSYIRSMDLNQCSDPDEGTSYQTDNYFYQDESGTVWAMAFGNNSLGVGSALTEVTYEDMVTNNSQAAYPFILCASPGDGFAVQAVNVGAGCASSEGYSNCYRGNTKFYFCGDQVYGKHLYDDAGIGLEFVVAALEAGDSVTFSWYTSLDENLSRAIQNIESEVNSDREAEVDPPETSPDVTEAPAVDAEKHTITSVQEFDSIAQVYGASFEELGLPQTAKVTLDDGSSYEVPVSWEGYDAALLGTQTLVGILDLTELQEILIESDDVPTAEIAVLLSELQAGEAVFPDYAAKYTGDPISYELTKTPTGVTNITYTYSGENDLESSTPPTQAGEYTVTAAFEMLPGYQQLDAVSAILTILPAEISVQISTEDGIFGLSDPVISAQIVGAIPGHEPELTLTYTGTASDETEYSGADLPTKPGDYTVTATIADENYILTEESTAQFAITKANESLSIASIATKTYGDEPFRLGISQIGDGTLTFNSSNPAIASVDETGLVTIHGAGTAILSVSAAETDYYNGSSASVILEIQPKEISVNLTASDGIYGVTAPVIIPTLTGTISGHEPELTLIYTGTASDGTEYSGADLPTKSGEYTVTATISDKNYVLTEENTAQFAITKATESLSVVPIATKTYGDEPFRLEISQIGDGTLTFNSSNPAIASVDETGLVTIHGAGTAILSVSAAETDYYNGSSASVILEIQPKEISVNLTASDGIYGVTAPVIIPTLTGTISGHEPELTLIYTGTASDGTEYSGADLPTKPGDYTVTATIADKNYVLTEESTAQFAITKASESLSVASIATKTYGDEPFQLEISQIGDGILAYKSSDPEVASVGETGLVTIHGAGTAILSISAAATDCYNGSSASVILGIQPKEISVNLTASDGIYGVTAPVIIPTLTGTILDNEPEVTLTYTGTASDGTEYSGADLPTKPGEYTVTATIVDENYVLKEESTAQFAITKASESLGIASVATKTYGDEPFRLEISQIGDGTLSYTSSNPEVASVDENGLVTIHGAGTVILSVSAAETDYYNGSNASVILDVEPKEISVSLAASDGIYDQLAPVITPTLIGTIPGNAPELTLTYTGTASDGTEYSGADLPTKPGEYTVTATISDKNYVLTEENTAQFAITKASESLSIASVATKTYGDEPFQLEISQIGDGTLSYTSSNPEVASVDETGLVTIHGAGTVILSVSASATDYYNGSNTSVILDVEPKEISVNLTASDGIYGATAPVITPTLIGTIPGNAPELTLTYTGTASDETEYSGADLPTKPGDYTVTATIADENYILTEESTAQFAITKANESLSIASIATKTYGDEPFRLEISQIGDGTLSYTSSNPEVASVDENGLVTIHGAGTVILSVSAAETDYYNGSNASVILGIQPKEISVNLTASDGIYGATAPVIIPTLTGTILDNEPEVTLIYTGTALDGTEYSSNDLPTKPGEYTVTATIVDENYVIAEDCTAQFAITKANESLSVVPIATKTYGDVPFQLEISQIGDGTLSYTSSNPEVASVDENGLVTIHGAGTVILSISAAATDYYNSANASVILNIEPKEISVSLAVTNGIYDQLVPVIIPTLTGTILDNEPEVTLIYTGTASDGTEYSGTDLPAKPGEYTVTATIADENYVLTEDCTAQFAITKASESLSVASIATKTYGDEPFRLEISQIGDGTLSYTSSNPEVASVDENGLVTIHGAGTVILSVSAAETDYYNGSNASVILDVEPKEISVNLTASDGIYGATAPVIIPTLTGTISGHEPELTLIYTGTASDGTEYSGADLPTKPGTYTVTATITDRNYKLVGETVAQMAITEESEQNNLAVLSAENHTNKGGETEPTEDTEVVVIADCDGGEACKANTFLDISTAKWYHSAVEYVITAGLMQGYGNGLFGPENPLKRGQMLQVLYNQAGCPVGKWDNPFTDVSQNAWYRNAVCWAAELDLINGYGDGRFGPEESMTREEMVVILWRQAGCPTAKSGSMNFTDAEKIHQWALEAMLWATENNIIRGMGDGTLAPDGIVTRAQLAQVLYNLAES